MVGLLDIAALRPAILEGLIASIGGLDGSLSAATTSALVQWLAAGAAALSLLLAPFWFHRGCQGFLVVFSG